MPPQQQMWLSLAHSIIITMSLLGNSVIIHIIRSDNAMRTTTNFFILNQACDDLLITITQSLNVFHHIYLDGLWFGGLFGQITCKLHLVIMSIAPYFSVWILVMIAVDRFCAVNRPLQLSPISRHLKKAILFIWLWCFVCSINVLVNGGLGKDKRAWRCDLESAVNNWTAVNVTDVSLNFFLPLLLITALYTAVCITLWSREVPGEGANQNAQQAEAMKTARKVTQMMIVVVILFVLCWLPYLIIVFLQLFGSMKISLPVMSFIGCLVQSYSGLNPFIYLTFNRNFRLRFKQLARHFAGKVLCFSPRSQSFELGEV